MALPHQLRAVSTTEPSAPSRIALGAYHLVLERTDTGGVVRLVGGDGAQPIELAITPEGAVLRLRSGLALVVDGELALTADQMSLHARRALRLTSDEQVDLRSGGDVALRANDDVKLNGERIELNC
jgi:hypothetical protein